MDGEDTLVIADSNGVSYSQHTPATWRVAAYRGGRLADVIRLLSSCPIPTHVKYLIVAVGINDRDSTEQPTINAVSRLRELLSLQTRHVAVLAVPEVEWISERQRRGTKTINELFRDLLSDAATIVSPAPDFIARRLVADDAKHVHAAAAQLLVNHLITHVSSLN